MRRARKKVLEAQRRVQSAVLAQKQCDMETLQAQLVQLAPITDDSILGTECSIQHVRKLSDNEQASVLEFAQTFQSHSADVQ